MSVATKAAAGRRIQAIHLVIGALSSVVDDSVQFYFDFLSRETLAEGAVLHFRRVPATAHCLQCHAEHAVVPPLPMGCPSCGSPRLRVSGGDEFQVESIEVDDEPA
jgi:hydrogenase nickel incorporation protein HypA/HybF